MWLVGAFIAACGTAVYVELGTVMFLARSKFRPCSHLLIRDFPGMEARKTI